MNAIILNGAAACGDSVDKLANPVQQALADCGIRAERIDLYDKAIAWCTGCFDCWTWQQPQCSTPDDGQAIAQRITRSDLLVLLTRITFGGYSSQLKKAIDRLLPDLAGRLGPRNASETGEYCVLPALLGIGVLQVNDPEAASLFMSLVRRNATSYHSWQAGSIVVGPGIRPETLADRIHGALSSMEVMA